MTTPARDSGLYVRPTLAAAGDGIVNPSALVAEWWDEASKLLNAVPDGSVAFRLLAVWGALRRARPELISGRSADLDTLGRRLAGPVGRELAGLARGQFRAEDWLVRAAALADSDLTDDVRAATSLLKELDEADLVAASMLRVGLADEAAEDTLDRCAAWFWEHAWAFTEAGVYAQAVAATFLPDLEDRDPFLTHSANKFVILLDMLEEIALEEARDTPNLATPPAGVRFKDLLQHVEYAAAAAAPTPGSLRVVEWASADGRFRARMRFPTTSTPALGAATRLLNFVRTADGEPAIELRGRTCRLGHIEARISPEGQAAFDSDDLWSAEAALSVNGDAPPWTLMPDQSAF